MSKLANAFGDKYLQNKISIITRSFELGNHTFKVRVPNVGELENIYESANNPPDELIEQEYQKLTANLKDLEVDGDVILEDGRSLREVAKNKAGFQIRITGYFKLLVPDTGASLENLEYSDIESEFPVAIQMEFFEAINNAISPDYKSIRGKS